MFESLNTRLFEAKDRLRQRMKAEGLLAKCGEELSQQRQKVDVLGGILSAQERALKQLHGLSVTHMFYAVVGKQQEQKERIGQEVLRAKLQCEACQSAVAHLEEECNQLKAHIQVLSGAEAEYQTILLEKERVLTQNTPFSARLGELFEHEADLRSESKETQEAINAATPALKTLTSCLESLSKAEDWGTWDMMGGGVLVTALKRDHMADAKNYASEAQNYLRMFTRELADLNQSLDVDMDTGGFLHFSDYFFDGLFVDWMVQKEIKESSRHVEDQLARVQTILENLHQRKYALDKELTRVVQERERVVEDAT